MKYTICTLLIFTLNTQVLAQSQSKLIADKGREYYKVKEYEKAIAQYDEALKIRPDWSVVYSFRSDAKRKKGDLQGALKDVNLSIKYDSLNHIPYIRRARILEELKDYQGAIADYGKILSISKEYYQAHGSRAKLRKKIGDIEGVIADYDALIKFNPKLTQAYKLKALFFAELKRYDEAIIQWDLVLEKDPNDGSAYYNRASHKLSLSTPDIKGACKDYQLAKENGIKEADQYLKRFCSK
jgi:tetratricopeptide (TPR) repeat protein